MTLYKNKYRIDSARLQGWDYANPGGYFITICTKNRRPYFGNIINGKMRLSAIGQIAHQYWGEIPNHFHNVRLDEYIVMPNHIHGILIIKNDIVRNCSDRHIRDDHRNHDDRRERNSGINNNPWKSGTIGVIINQYKRICTIRIRKTNPEFAWQSRFYDNIIRDGNHLNCIRKYIIDNPLFY